MKKYRLKEKAYPFFKRDLGTKVLDLDDWIRVYNVSEEALEEVEECYVTPEVCKGGHSSDICGWTNPNTSEKNKGAEFYFTIHFPSMKYCEYDEFSKGTMLRKLLDEVQRNVNCWYNQYQYGEDEQNL